MCEVIAAILAFVIIIAGFVGIVYALTLQETYLESCMFCTNTIEKVRHVVPISAITDTRPPLCDECRVKILGKTKEEKKDV